MEAFLWKSCREFLPWLLGMYWSAWECDAPSHWCLDHGCVSFLLEDAVLGVPLRAGHVKRVYLIPLIKNTRFLFLYFHVEEKQKESKKKGGGGWTGRVLTFCAVPLFLGHSVSQEEQDMWDWWGWPDNGSQGFIFACVLWCWREVLFMRLHFLWDLLKAGRWLKVGN